VQNGVIVQIDDTVLEWTAGSGSLVKTFAIRR
jgi:hypothetical protein